MRCVQCAMLEAPSADGARAVHASLPFNARLGRSRTRARRTARATLLLWPSPRAFLQVAMLLCLDVLRPCFCARGVYSVRFASEGVLCIVGAAGAARCCTSIAQLRILSRISVAHRASRAACGWRGHMAHIGYIGHLAHIGYIGQMAHIGYIGHMAHIGYIGHMAHIGYIGHMAHIGYIGHMAHIAACCSIAYIDTFLLIPGLIWGLGFRVEAHVAHIAHKKKAHTAHIARGICCPHKAFAANHRPVRVRRELQGAGRQEAVQLGVPDLCFACDRSRD